MTFTYYIGIDYSSQDRKQKTWAAVGRRSFMGFELQRLESIGRDGLPDLLREYASHRVLVALDFPFSWPVGFVTTLIEEPPRSWVALAQEIEERWTLKKLQRKRGPYVRRNGTTLRLTDTYQSTTSPLQNTYPDLMTMVWYGMKALAHRPPTYRVVPFERLEPAHSTLLEVAPEVTLQKLGIPHTQYHGESDIPAERRREILRQLRLSNLVPLDTASTFYKEALENDDALDAILCGLTGTFFSGDAGGLGITLAPPSPNEMRRISLEGWIYAPALVTA
jgi:hypothetical protein